MRRARDLGSQLRELSGEPIRSGDRGEHADLAAPQALRGLESAAPELPYSAQPDLDTEARGFHGERGAQLRKLGSAVRESGPHDRAGLVERARGLAERTSREHVTVAKTEPRIHADEVDVPVQAMMLEAVV